MKRAFAFRGVAVAACALGLALLAGCSSDEGVAPADTFYGKLIRGSDAPAQEVDKEITTPQGYCPKVTIRAGTQTYLVTASGSGGKKGEIRYQGTLTDTARECDRSTGVLKMRVGVSGRVVTGPKGGAGTVHLPLRVVALIPKLEQTEQKVLYTKLHDVVVQIPEGQGSVPWAFIDEEVVVDTTERFRIYVGFDSSKK